MAVGSERQTGSFLEQDSTAVPKFAYDSFSEKYGLINDRANRLAYADDSSYYLLCALEVIDEDGKLERKADMFTKRTIKPHQAVAVVDTASEALAVSISEKACVDMDYMSQLTGKTKEELAGELQGVIFRVPGQLEQDGTPHYVTADESVPSAPKRSPLTCVSALHWRQTGAAVRSTSQPLPRIWS